MKIEFEHLYLVFSGSAGLKHDNLPGVVMVMWCKESVARAMELLGTSEVHSLEISGGPASAMGELHLNLGRVVAP